jgi:GTP-binding protein HflX
LRSKNTVTEKALLVVLKQKGAGDAELCMSLAEFEHLARSAGAGVAGSVHYTCRTYDPAFFITAGRLEALKAQVMQNAADFVIFDSDLTPAQQHNLEDFLEVKVIDRTALILDIFAQRARSREGKLQVELAQLGYLMPRLKGRGIHMSRLGGGIGTRGPGETQLEADRRSIKDRMQRLSSSLRHVETSRRVQRQNRIRQGAQCAALVGYTNAGKSTLLNLLAGSNVKAENRLFSTLDPTTRKVSLAGGGTVLLSDTVGFIRDLPHQLVAAFKATLEEVREAQLLLHVIDCTSPCAEEQAAAVDRVLEELGARDRETIFVLNKIDAVQDQGVVRRLLRRFKPAAAVSARTGQGIDGLRSLLDRWLVQKVPHMYFRLPATEKSAINRIMMSGTVLYSACDESDVLIEARIDSAIAHNLRRFAVPSFRHGDI